MARQWKCTMLDVQQLHSFKKKKKKGCEKKRNNKIHLYSDAVKICKITSKKEFKLWGVIKTKQIRKQYWMRKLKKSPKCFQVQIQSVHICQHSIKNTRKVFITALAFWTRELLMRTIGGQFCYRLQDYLLIRADWLLFCAPNSFDILSWLPEVPWVGKAAIPLG